MEFNSILFLLYFLPISLAVYYAVPAKLKNTAFLIESIVFYACGASSVLPVIAVLTGVNYIAAIVQSSKKSIKLKKAVCGVSIAVTLLALVLFKYFDYIRLLAQQVSLSGLGSLRFFDILPLGISYYTFKLISYQADVFREKVQPEKNIINFALYTIWFPQILVGPIIRYADLRDSLHHPKNRCTFEKFSKGVQLFVFGLAMKVILADGIGALWAEVSGDTIGLANASGPLVWLAVSAYSLQLYLDFAGFSYMSNGLSYMFGFACKQNFRYPYISRSITEFWTRWHISLSEWFKDYVYIPLGGNRKGWKMQIFNLLVVWLLTGIWHSSGTSFNFILWGLYYFVILVLEKKLLKPYLDKGKVWPHLYSLLIAAVGWGIFACTSETVTVSALFSGLFRFSGGISPLYYLRSYGILFLACMIFSTPLPQKLWSKTEKIKILQPIILAALLIICIAYVVTGTATTALYAGF